MRILLVEDDRRVGAVMTSMLQRRGYAVEHAATATAALEAAPCDLVLLDLNLPDGDGIDVCRVLRARTPAGIEQEVYALLVTYQLLRTAITEAVMADTTGPRLDPDRASFTIAWQTARDQIVQAAGVIAETVIDLVGTIGRRVLAEPLAARRHRVSPRIVKRAISKYQARGPNIDRASYQATLSIDILTGAPP